MKLAATLIALLAANEASASNVRTMKKEKNKKPAKKAKADKQAGCSSDVKKVAIGNNPCAGSQVHLPNIDCVVDGVVKAVGQAGADVSVGYKGNLDMGDVKPVTKPYWEQGICPVNVHWHLGAEHRSEGQYDETVGKGPAASDSVDAHRNLEEGARLGLRCGHYDDADPKFTTEYDWQHCVDMKVGETYEVHWPHSYMGACGTVNQYQTPFYDGVFCNADKLDIARLQEQVGVQAQVFTIVNDEDYYFPNLFGGMIVDEGLGMGVEVTKYTGSTTGTSRSNDICSSYGPITWQVDRKCHMISASTFDKMCADMKAQRDDMSEDLYPHGSREVVADHLASNNHENRKLSNFIYD